MPERALMLAVGDTNTKALTKDRAGFISINLVYQPSAVAFTGVVEVSNDDMVSWTTPAKLHDTVAGELAAEVASMTTDKQTCWLRNPGYTHVRLRCTAFTTPGQGVQTRINAVNA